MTPPGMASASLTELHRRPGKESFSVAKPRLMRPMVKGAGENKLNRFLTPIEALSLYTVPAASWRKKPRMKIRKPIPVLLLAFLTIVLIKKVKEIIEIAKSSMRKKYKPKAFFRKKLNWKMQPKVIRMKTVAVLYVARVTNQVTQ